MRRLFTWRDQPVNWLIDDWMERAKRWLYRVLTVSALVAIPWQCAYHVEPGTLPCDWRCVKGTT